MNKIIELTETNWSDAQILELSYSNNDIIKLKIKNYQEDIFIYEFNNVFRLFFENCINEDIGCIKHKFHKEENESICTISITSAWSDKDIVCFSFFTE